LPPLGTHDGSLSALSFVARRGRVNRSPYFAAAFPGIALPRRGPRDSLDDRPRTSGTGPAVPNTQVSANLGTVVARGERKP